MKAEEQSGDGPRFEFGEPCPRIKTVFFPNDQQKSPTEIQEGEDNDSAQPPRG